MAQRHGDTLIFSAPPVIAAHAAVGGKKESRSPLAEGFDELSRDNRLGQKTWEAAEKVLQLRAARLCLQKAGAAERSVNLVLVRPQSVVPSSELFLLCLVPSSTTVFKLTVRFLTPSKENLRQRFK